MAEAEPTPCCVHVAFPQNHDYGKYKHQFAFADEARKTTQKTFNTADGGLYVMRQHATGEFGRVHFWTSVAGQNIRVHNSGPRLVAASGGIGFLLAYLSAGPETTEARQDSPMKCIPNLFPLQLAWCKWMTAALSDGSGSSNR